MAQRVSPLRIARLSLTLGAALLLLPARSGDGASRQSFGFNGSVSGFPTGAVTLTGGGAYDPTVADNASGDFVHSSGGFSCTADVHQGPLSGSPANSDPCLAGEGVRWDTAQLLHDTKFKCTGAATEVAQTATTSDTTVVLLSDFYRAGDANDESFTGKMIVTSDPNGLPGHPDQNIWVEGVGCGTAIVHFSRGRP